ncbi:MAG: DMT family transporter, partial [Pseudomonadota bacterium]
MPGWLLTVTALFAFAANSLLCRAALADDAIDPGSFTAIRVLSGVVALALLVALRGGIGGAARRASPLAGAALLTYAAFFSFAYVTLDAGIGALILFGTVQVAMLAGAVVLGEKPGAARYAGATMGLAGLAWLTLPGASAPPLQRIDRPAEPRGDHEERSEKGRRARPRKGQPRQPRKPHRS